MSNALTFDRRRTLILMGGAAIAPASAAQTAPVVTLLGDSILAGYNLAPEAGPAARLQAALQGLKIAAVVRNAGVPGDTSGGVLGRMDGALKRDTAVCVVGIGANDRARGWPANVTRLNVEKILRRLEEKKISVILAGTGVGRGGDFDAIFPSLAQAYKIAVLPDLMAGVTREAGLRQNDGAHPNARGAEIIAQALAPLVATALKSRA